ncbi:hypothetical protein TcasGA2_TC011850 [Tribolium castaneum]|uniref:Uncharacterized protein n=1 Tax=Tribolium castaneum TaxID=7070 RepID=D6WZE6_TRICA|nr:hypothetical protein TcasGA2_TC011850 [Tribolium castaneum]
MARLPSQNPSKAPTLEPFFHQNKSISAHCHRNPPELSQLRAITVHCIPISEQRKENGNYITARQRPQGPNCGPLCGPGPQCAPTAPQSALRLGVDLHFTMSNGCLTCRFVFSSDTKAPSSKGALGLGRIGAVLPRLAAPDPEFATENTGKSPERN